MSVKIGSARIDENGRASGGMAGDQTGREVAEENWYRHPLGWILIRAKTAAMREKLARNMEAACDNPYIGYDQSQNTSLWNVVKGYAYDCAKVRTACETDCARLVRVCCWYAGSKPKDFYTASEVDALKATGDFDILTADKYTKTSSNLMRGDILVTKTKGHTVIVLSNGENVKAVPENQAGSVTTVQAKAAARSFDRIHAGTYKTKTAMNIRNNAGTAAKKLGVLPAGTEVKCYGYYTEHLGTDWLYAIAEVGAVRYVGFISSNAKYLAKTK